jgi:hypothetical protein
MLESFPYIYIPVYITAFAISIAFLAGTFIILQMAWDRFWTVSFPILLETYDRWKNPDDYVQEDN